MSDKGIVLKVDECKILNTMDDMCAESLPPDLHNVWEEIMACLIDTRHQFAPLAIPAGGWAHICKDGERHTTFDRYCQHGCGAMYATLSNKEERAPEIFLGTLDALSKLGA